MKIKQAYVSHDVRRFKNRWFKMFDFEEYTDVNKPAVFFYNTLSDLDIILNHKTKCIVVITSSHFKGLEQAANNLNKPNIKILATSKISEVLTTLNIKHEWPKNGIFVEKVDPVILGDKIYTYIPMSNKNSFIYYGGNIINQIDSKYQILTGDGKITMDQWYNGECEAFYGSIFLGLNLSNNAAGQTTIIDLGLRGIPCITNVTKMPHTISWNTIEDIKNIIEDESKNIGKINYDLARQVYESMDYEQKWLEID